MRNYKNIKGNKIEQSLKEILAVHDKFKNVYYWHPAGSASQRRALEKRYDMTFSFRYKDSDYSIERNIYCSCSHTKYRLEISIDGEKKNITAIKKLLK